MNSAIGKFVPLWNLWPRLLLSLDLQQLAPLGTPIAYHNVLMPVARVAGQLNLVNVGRAVDILVRTGHRDPDIPTSDWTQMEKDSLTYIDHHVEKAITP